MPAFLCDVTTSDDETTVDWDGPGTFYYRTDRTEALVLTDIDDPDRTPAFETAADIATLIDSGDWDLPANAFGLCASATFKPAPTIPAEVDEDGTEVEPAKPDPSWRWEAPADMDDVAEAEQAKRHENRIIRAIDQAAADEDVAFADLAKSLRSHISKAESSRGGSQ